MITSRRTKRNYTRQCPICGEKTKFIIEKERICVYELSPISIKPHIIIKRICTKCQNIFIEKGVLRW